MKRCIMLMALLLCVTNVLYGWRITVENQTNEKKYIKVEYLGSGVCWDDVWVIPRNDVIDKPVGGCCLSRAYLVKENKAGVYKRVKGRSKIVKWRAGFGESECADHYITIHEDGTLSREKTGRL